MEQTVEQKLKALWLLQAIHTKVDKIRQVRGELPMEVSDLEDEIAGLETRIEKIRGDIHRGCRIRIGPLRWQHFHIGKLGDCIVEAAASFRTNRTCLNAEVCH